MRPAPFLLERYFAGREFSASYQLSGSDCETLRVGDLLALVPDAARQLAELPLGYTESAGAPPLRAAVAALYDDLTPDGVLVHSGAQEAVFTLVNAILSAGDHAIVQWPCYQSLFELPRAAGAAVSPWRADPATWAPDPDELSDLVRPETRLLVVNSPHNPTCCDDQLNLGSTPSCLSPDATAWCCCSTRSTGGWSMRRTLGCRPPATPTSAASPWG